jgi:methionyl-tRNA synthetase
MFKDFSFVELSDFDKIVLKTALVIGVRDVPRSKKLLAVDLQCNGRSFTIVSGIKQYYPQPLSLVGRYVVFIENLAPRDIMGERSAIHRT